MPTIGTITQMQGRASFGSAGGVTVKMEDGKFQYHPFSRLEGSEHFPVVGSTVEILDRGRAWRLLPQADLHPDSHPEPLPVARVPRSMRPAAPVVVPPTELNVFELILAQQELTNNLLTTIIQKLST